MARTDAHRPYHFVHPDGWDHTHHHDADKHYSREQVEAAENRVRRRRDRHLARAHIMHGRWDALRTVEGRRTLYWW